MQGTCYHGDWDWHYQEATTIPTVETQKEQAVPQETVRRPCSPPPLPSLHSHSPALWLNIPLAKHSKKPADQGVWESNLKGYFSEVRIDQGKKEYLSGQTSPRVSKLLIHSNCWVRTASEPAWIIWDTSLISNMIHQLRGPGGMFTSLGGKGRERVTCSQPDLYPLSAHLYHPSAGLHYFWGEAFLKDPKSKSISKSEQKRKEKTISFSLSFLSSLTPPLLSCAYHSLSSLPSFPRLLSPHSSLYLYFQFLPLSVYISSLQLHLIPPEELHELTSLFIRYAFNSKSRVSLTQLLFLSRTNIQQSRCQFNKIYPVILKLFIPFLFVYMVRFWVVSVLTSTTSG